MKKGQLPVFPELTLADIKDSTAKITCKFTGTDNPRFLRVIHALLARAMPREHLDRIAGCSNGPDLIATLRRMGLGKLGLPCTMIPDCDRDGLAIRRGVYSFSDAGRRAIYAWMRTLNVKAAKA